MKPSPSCLSLGGWLATALLLAAAGCSSGPDVNDTVDSMGHFGTETAKAKDCIDDTLRTLQTLVGTQGSDLKVPFDAYSKSLATLDQQAILIRARAEEMKATGDAVFAKWEAEANANVTPQRRADLNADYARIKEEMANAGRAFLPFLASLKDIQSYLKLDLSVTGIQSVGPLVKKAGNDGVEVKSRIESVLGRLNAVRGMLSTKPAE